MRVLFGPDPIQFPEGRRVWICSVCGRDGRWAKGWQRYGSLLDEDCGELLFVVCSDDCASSVRAKQLERACTSLGKRQMHTGRYSDDRLLAAQVAAGVTP